MRIDVSVGWGRLERDVRVEAPEAASLAAVLPALADAVGAPHGASLWCGTDLLSAATPITDARLRTGARLRFGAAATGNDRAGVLAMHVVGGSRAGLILPLERGRLSIGRASDNGVVLPDANVSRRHAVLDVSAAGITVHDAGSSNGTWVDGRLVPAEGAALRVGAIVRVGDSLLSVAGPPGPPATVHRDADGALAVRRSSRRSGGLPDQVIVLPQTVAQPRPRGVQWVTALLPAMAGGALAWMSGQPQFLFFALLSPAMLVASALGDRAHWRRSRRKAARTLRIRRAETDRQIDHAVVNELAGRRAAGPDPAAVRRSVTLPDTAVWARHRADPDLLSVRVGTADQASAVAVRDGAAHAPARLLADVPLSVDLRAGALGLAGPRAVVTACGRWLVGQLGALTAPTDLELIVLAEPDRRAEWRWTRWLPHVRAEPARTPEEFAAVVDELAALVEQRSRDLRSPEQRWHGKWLVVVVDRIAPATESAGLADVLARGAAVGITAIWLEDDPAALPGCCVATARVVGSDGTRVRVAAPATDERCSVIDQVSAEWAETVGRNLAPLVDAGAAGAETLPGTCTLLAAVSLPDVTPEAIAERWAASDGAARAVLGHGPAGPIAFDLASDGPHALVAGTTGSGKSELLRTLVVGLGVHHPPGEVNVLLIDYKGGAAFADCARLPHCAGLVTDLDQHQTRRALRSLQAELRRRERLFAQANATDLAGYRRAANPPIPRLVIVIDEFAALANELPEFLSGLVGVAQRGRSLGIHLVLATQRVGTAVTPEIRANTTARIALRVTDASESREVIDSPLAAAIELSHPGRAYLRAGSALTCFQTAEASGFTAPETDGARVQLLDGWRRPVAPAQAPSRTDLVRLVEAIRGAARETGAATALSPWLPALPDALPREALGTAQCATTVRIGRADLPDEQRQTPVELDLAAGGSLLVAGGPRSGRTGALIALCLAAADALAPADLQLLVVDATGTLAAALRPLPHCTTVLGPGELGLAPRLLSRVQRESAQRLARGRGSSGDAWPTLLVVIDGWDAVCSALPDIEAAVSADRLIGLLRTAMAAGCAFGVSGDRTVLAPRLAGGFGERVLLRLPDGLDAAVVGMRSGERAPALPPGRGIRLSDAALVQFATPTAGPGAVSAEAAALATRWGGIMPGPTAIRIQPLPDLVEVADLPAPPPGRLALGLAGDERTPVAIDPFSGAGRCLVAGPPRSGRSSLLCLLATQAWAAGIPIITAAPARSPLAVASRIAGVAVFGPDASPPATPTAQTLVLVDDSEAFDDTELGLLLADWARDTGLPVALVVASRSGELATSYRGVGYEVRRHRCGILLRPGPLDGELLRVRLTRPSGTDPPGRGIAVGDPSWGPPFAQGEPVPIQLASASGVGQPSGLPMCG